MEVTANDYAIEAFTEKRSFRNPVYFIYKLECKANNKIYVGRTVIPRNRFAAHKNALKRGDHPNKGLQMDFNRYGEENFTFTIIDTGRNSEIKNIKKYNADDPKYGYNYDFSLNWHNAHQGVIHRHGGKNLRTN